MTTDTPSPAGFPDFDAAGRSPLPDRSGAADLVHAYYAPVHRLAYAVAESDAAARQAAVRTLAAAHRDRAALASGGALWLYSLALKEIQRLGRPPKPPAGETEPERRLVNGWNARERLLATLHYLLERPLAESAALLKVSAGTVQTQLDIFQEQFAALPDAGPGPAGPPATVRILEPGRPPLTPVELRLVAALRQRWPLPDLSGEEIEALSGAVARQAAVSAAPAGRRLDWRLALIVALGVICGLAGLGAWLLVDSGVIPLTRPTPTAAIAGFPTPFPPTPAVERLTRRSTSDEIRFRWQESPRLWPSVLVDVQIVDYGPPSYVGPARSYRAQGWVLQPDQGLELFGLLSEPAGQVVLVGGGRTFTRSYVMDRSWSETWSGEAVDLLSQPGLRSLVFPATSPWAQRTGSLWWAGHDPQTRAIAGRSVVIFDWLNHLNQREARLWIDAETGLILREQVFSGENFERLQRESLVTEIAFGRREPPPALIVAARQSQAPAAATPGFQAIAPTPTPAFAATPPAPIPTDPAPPGMDPAPSRLIFQFASEPSPANLQSNTASVPAALFADGYYLGEVRFGLPWVLRCHRSADGRRLAFNTGSDGASAPDDSLRWFNLNTPGRIYQPLPGFHAHEFAFDPAGRTLAVSGSGENGAGAAGLSTGIYLVEIATGEYSRLLEVAEPRSLVWSPDGEFLALIGRLPGDELPALLVVHVRTGLIAYQGEAGQVNGPPPLDSPLTEWEVPFPVTMGGMEACATARR